MHLLLIAIFVIGYLAIAFEHPLKLNKAPTALLLGIASWVVYVGSPGLAPPVPEWFSVELPAAANAPLHFAIEHQLLELTGETAGLLFFLLGAMTIVELVDANHGFDLVSRYVRSSDARKLLWLVGWLAFFMSSVLDNLTTTIVMISILRKLVPEQKWRHYFVGVVVIAANAGGAWTPIGDVTTTMLWIAGKFTSLNLMAAVVAPSLVCLAVPLIALSFVIPKRLSSSAEDAASEPAEVGRQALFLSLGLFGLLSVPLFKTLTHLPPFMGMLLSLGVIWVLSDIVGRRDASDSHTGIAAVLQRIDMSSILFFLGILLAVGALGASGILAGFAQALDATIGDRDYIAMAIGLASAVVDNVPLVAAGLNMYALPAGDDFWLLLAYCAGTGGSCLIIGSAAGVAAMGLEKIDFLWYLKRISPFALLGYLAGAWAYVALAS